MVGAGAPRVIAEAVITRKEPRGLPVTTMRPPILPETTG